MKQQIHKEAIKQLILQLETENSVKAVLVVESKTTGKDYTYAIVKSIKRGTNILSIGNETFAQNFNMFYHIINGKPTNKSFSSENTKGGKWLLDKFSEGNIDFIMENCNIYHTGNCIKCNRPLTDLESIEYGMGPICRSKSEIKMYNREE